MQLNFRTSHFDAQMEVSQNPHTMTKQIILTIEDDAAIRRGIVDALTWSGYQVREVGDGTTGLQMATEISYDLLLLDLALPGVTGLEILGQVRQRQPTTPVIILTAKGDESDRVRGLKLGADDYVVKPFSVKELMARVEAVLRRSAARPQVLERVDFANGTVYFERREICYHDNEQASLSEKEAELLQYLAANPSRAISRNELLANVWKLSPQGISTRTIDMHIARLREKLRDDGERPVTLLTVRGKGYMWATLENHE